MFRRFVPSCRRAVGTQVAPTSVGPIVPADYVKLLGSNLVTLWHQAYGVTLGTGNNLASWQSYVGDFVLTPGSSGLAPQYAADSTYFNSKPVVQIKSNGHYLLHSGASIVPAGGRPYMFFMWRQRQTNTGFWAYTMAIQPDKQFGFITETGGHQCANVVSSASNTGCQGTAADTVQHLDEVWLDGTNLNWTHDGTNLTAANVGTLVDAVTDVCLGRPEPEYNADLSFFLAGVCTVAPSPEQLAALRALVAADAT